MNIRVLAQQEPWQWPEDSSQIILETLQDPKIDAADRLLAAELAGDLVAMNNELARTLLDTAGNSQESEELRSQAAISLGPVLELADIDEFDDPDSIPISETMFRTITERLSELFKDQSQPRQVRRSILEASVRAGQEWHLEAIQQAYESPDRDWRLTAVFCMRFVRGFESRIMESLESDNEDIHYHAVIAAGNWEVDQAWPHIAALAESLDTEKSLRLAAIEALGTLRPHESGDILFELLSDEDEDVVDAASEAVSMSSLFLDDLDEEEFDDEEDEDPFHDS